MAALNFDNKYDPAHTTADFGGDMLTQFAKDIAHVKLDKWYVLTWLCNHGLLI